jgi:ABC-type lipoprotein export system ATPase subunit
MVRLISIEFLEDYRMFKKDQAVFFTELEYTRQNEGILLSVLAGRNGTGKTTLLSLVARLFHHLERYRGKLDVNFKLKYLLEYGGTDKLISIVHIDDIVRINIPDFYENKVLIPFVGANRLDKRLAKKYGPDEIIDYPMFNNFCPKSIVSSAFSVHGEYPNKRAHNFEGFEPLRNYNINYIYGKNHFALRDFTRGIKRFVLSYIENKEKFNQILSLFELKFTGRVLEYTWEDQDNWVKVDSKWKQQIEGQIADGKYLNDLEFVRSGHKISFSNMSAGEKMLLLRLITILDGIEDDSIVIIEEPELHLDQVWCKQIISILDLLFKKNGAHFLIATHNLSLINSVPKENVIRLDWTKSTTVESNTFLAANEDLINSLYGDSGRLNIVERDVLKSISNPLVTKEELEYLDSILGDSIYKYLVYKKLKKIRDVESK